MSEKDAISTKESMCIVRHGYYPSELNVKREAEALLHAGYDVHVLCLRRNGESVHETIDGVHVRRLPVEHRRGGIGRYLYEYNAFFILASLELVRLCVRYRLRVVQVNTMPDYLVFTTLLPRLFGTKAVLHMHEPMPELFETIFSGTRHQFLMRSLRWVERLSLAYADSVITVTREMRDNFGLRGARTDKISVIVNVPDERIFKLDDQHHVSDKVARTKEQDRRNGIFRIVCHGTIEERYGIDVVVRALARLKDTSPRLRFRLMGRGGFIPDVLELAEKLDVSSNVEYLGFVPHEQMIEEILSADVTVVPMKKNHYSDLVHTNKMYEYIELGQPVIASRLRSVERYFPDDTILYFRPDDDADLAEQLRYASSHPEEMRKRAVCTRTLYDAFRWEREKNKYLEVYESLLGPAKAT